MWVGTIQSAGDPNRKKQKKGDLVSVSRPGIPFSSPALDIKTSGYLHFGLQNVEQQPPSELGILIPKKIRQF